MSTLSRLSVSARNDPRNIIRSLALSVYFKNPSFGMKQYEVLSRATAFLLSVDPYYEPYKEDTSGLYDHLGSSEKTRMERNFRREYGVDPAGGPPGRTPQELGWLEYCPTKYRPIVHCVASSHVLAPWRWPQFYPQEWLRHVEQKHCEYSLEVFCPSNPEGEPLAKFALNPYPIHHPGGLDLAVIHLKEEESSLKLMENLGVEMLYLRDFEKDEPFISEEFNFEGFQVAQMDLVESQDFKANDIDEEDNWDDVADAEKNGSDGKDQKDDNGDARTFIPYTVAGQLLFGKPDRFLASTPNPLPQGLCGGPVLDKNDRVAGIVEGIVPVNHEDKRIAGSAAFIPSIQLRHFLDDYAERIMLEQIMPSDLFDKVIRLKEGRPFRDKDTIDAESILKQNEKEKADGKVLDKTLENMLKNIKKHHSPEETNAIMDMIRRERDEVLKILDREGGDVDEVIARVRAETRAKQKEELERLLENEKENSSKILSDTEDAGTSSDSQQATNNDSSKK